MKKIIISCFVLLLIQQYAFCQKPKIVNIVNFIRLLEPRDKSITEDVLFQTVVKQIALMRKQHLPGTFLLQYDALMDPRYQKLLNSLPRDSFEIGAWWEIPEPLVEHAGMKWRGRYPWDWRANIGFSTGYSPDERVRLIDTYMKDFKRIFGYYPKSVASWFIDAYSLNYMYEKYHIVASANCKDQYGTDGYTLWGGYWNQAYYPSKINAYMPAQHASKQIPVPIFRMLGSDPIRQYDDGLMQDRQGVVTLEPVYGKAGGNADWVHWFLQQFVDGACMAFAYTQAGQENSFTWHAMAKGLEMQFPLLEKLRDEGKIKVETLAQSGAWFKNNFSTTPSTSVTALRDLPGGDKRTIWFDSKYYRANLLWDNGTLRFRDIHLFNENIPSPYIDRPTTSNECHLFTLPFVDGYLWSDKTILAGLWFKTIVNHKEVLLQSDDKPVVSDGQKGILKISWHLKNIPGVLYIAFTGKQITIQLKTPKAQTWFLDLTTANKAVLPFKSIAAKAIQASSENFNYAVTASKGLFNEKAAQVFRLSPEHNKIVLNMDDYPHLK